MSRLFLLFAMLSCTSLHAQVQILLRKSFIDSMKDRICYTGSFTLINTPEKINPENGIPVLPVSCMEPVIGLPVVAKIVNANENRNAVKQAHFTAGTDNPAVITGVWRLWADNVVKEKGDKEMNYEPKKQSQGNKYKFSGSNPPHVFELQPVLQIGDADCKLNDIAWNDLKPADKVFTSFTNTTCELTDLDTRVLINLTTPSYTYTDFWIRPIAEDPLITVDGRFVTCDVYNEKGDIIANNVRIGFLKSSETEKAIMNLNSVEKLHIVGMSRLSLHDISKNIEGNNGVATPQPLPYEMIAIASLN